MKKILILLIITLCMSNIQAMKRAADPLTDLQIHKISTSPFENLPTEIKYTILMVTEPAAWSACAHVNKELNTLVNHPNNHREYIKKLSERTTLPYYLLAQDITTCQGMKYYKNNTTFHHLLLNPAPFPSPDTLQKYKSKIDPHYTFENSNELIHIASKSGSLEKLKSLIDLLKPDLNKQNTLGETALMLASSAQTVDYLASLSSVNKESIDKLGLTALFWAVRESNVETVKTLLKYGAKKDIYLKTCSSINKSYFWWPLEQEALFRNNTAILNALHSSKNN